MIAAASPKRIAAKTAGAAKRARPASGRGATGDARGEAARVETVDLRHDSLGYAIKRAQVRTYEMLFAWLGPDALSPARMTALSIIGAQAGINQSALAEQLGVTRAGLVKVIDSLEARGLAERRAIKDDRRSYALALTPRGRDELRALQAKVQQHEQRIAAALTPRERAQLIALLERVAAAPDPEPTRRNQAS